MSTNERKKFIEKDHQIAIRDEYQQRNFQIAKLSGKDCFVEVMNGQFHAGKVILNFEQFDESKPKGQRTTNKVTIYMPFDKFLLLKQDFISGKIAKLAEKEKAQNKYPQPVFTDLTGTASDILAKFNASRPDGKSESRQLKLIPGLKADFMIQAESGPGEKSATGLIAPKYGNKPEQKVAVPVSNDDLKKLFLITEMNIQSYLTSQYMLRASDIRRERADEKKQSANANA